MFSWRSSKFAGSALSAVDVLRNGSRARFRDGRRRNRVLASAPAVGPLYFLVRAWRNERIAFWTCLLYALHPVRVPESAAAWPTGLFLGPFVAALSAGVPAFRGGGWALYPLAGLAVVGAYVTVRLVRERAGTAVWRRFGTGKLSDDKITKIVEKVFDFRPYALIEYYKLRRRGAFLVSRTDRSRCSAQMFVDPVLSP